MRLRRATAFAAALALAAPASALAQSAGDDQYRDPFAGEDQPRQDAGSGNSGQPAPPPAGGSAPAPPPAPSPTAVAPPVEPVATTAQTGMLPRTGSAAVGVALAGVLMLAVGIGLRRRAAA